MNEVLHLTWVERTFDELQVGDEFLILGNFVTFEVLLLDKLKKSCLLLIKLLLSQFFFINFLGYDSAQRSNYAKGLNKLSLFNWIHSQDILNKESS